MMSRSQQFRLATTTTRGCLLKMTLLGLVPSRTEGVQIMNNSDPVPQDKMFFLQQKRQIRHNKGWNFSSVLYLKNITIQHTVMLRTTTMIKHRMHRFKKLNLSILFVHGTRDHPIAQVSWKSTWPVQTRRQLAIDLKMCMFVLTDELHQFDRLKVLRTSLQTIWQDDYKAKVVMENKKDEDTYRNFATKHDLILRPKYALEILKKHNMDNCHSIGTPLATKPKLDVDLSGEPVDQSDYRSKIGSLMYLTSSRPDLVQADSGFELTAFSDADHAGCLDTQKSTSGGIQFLGDKLVSWMSKKQNCTAMSSAEAEYVALSASCAQVMWMRTQLQDYGFNYNKIPLYCDSQSAIAISCNPVQHSRTKHIHTRYHFIKEQVENGIIKLYFVRTEYQLADMFTKALPEDRFKYLVRRIGMRCLTPADLEVLTNETA
ncbi:hypothetical protein Tco_0906665 [Tanacetum coccineum]|uniref:Uncharacterized protein n=1 Tax=Tanacetum coccineum TaxID=301880 RepID=A0ABQ5CHF4_9ASTR